MPERILFPEWRDENASTKYPFSEAAALTNSEGRVLLVGTFLDAALYPIGSVAGIYLAKVTISFDTCTLTLGDPNNANLASGSFALHSPPSRIVFSDSAGRPAGMIVSESTRLAVFQSWGVGTHTFQPAESEFAATVCLPTPAPGVRGIELVDGSILAGEVWIVGDDGVVVRSETVTLPATCKGNAQTIQAIRVDVVGDPLFRRRLCVPNALFNTPRFIKQVQVTGPNGSVTCGPDEFGNMVLTQNNRLARDTALRMAVEPGGMYITITGSLMENDRGLNQ